LVFYREWELALEIPWVSEIQKRQLAISRWQMAIGNEQNLIAAVVRFCFSSVFLRALCGKGFWFFPITRDVSDQGTILINTEVTDSKGQDEHRFHCF